MTNANNETSTAVVPNAVALLMQVTEKERARSREKRIVVDQGKESTMFCFEITPDDLNNMQRSALRKDGEVIKGQGNSLNVLHDGMKVALRHIVPAEWANALPVEIREATLNRKAVITIGVRIPLEQ